jgi:hypothetical protein
MKRREAIKSGILTLAGVSTLKFRPVSKAYHFIAVGSHGGRILEAFHHRSQKARYTWIQDGHTTVCDVPDLNRILVNHPYHERYFYRSQDVAMPNEPRAFDSTLLELKTDEFDVILVDPACYLSYHVLPRLISCIQNNRTEYQFIMRLPFSFEPEPWQKTTTRMIRELGTAKACFSVFSSESIRAYKPKMNLKQAFDLTYLQYVKEYEVLVILLETKRG